LTRKCKIKYSEITGVSESGTKKIPGPPLNEKSKKNPEIRLTQKNHKSASKRKLAGNETKIWECDKCGKKFGSRQNLNQHLETHKFTNDFICRVCGKAFKTSACRSHHEKRHTAPKVHCEICGRKLKNRFSLYEHLRNMHSDREKFTCGICQKMFACKQNLREHERRIHKMI
jgi:DNA-directed RNA polymerase subunit M/transcription elongation factor TFIIS